MQEKLDHVAIVGAGLMGLGIGIEFARFGYKVSLFNQNAESSRKAMAQAREDLDLMAETGLITKGEAEAAYGRLRPTTDLADAVSGAGYVVESIPEILRLKQTMFARLDELCPPSVILATNTSGMRVTDIASPCKHPERVLATHYFQPPHFVPLVEVSGGMKTERGIIDKVAEILRGLRKKVVIIEVELPGFIGNRLQGALTREIRSLVDQGAATPAMIDDVIRFGFGRRMANTGYFRRLDLIGLKGMYNMAKARGEKPWGPVAEKVERGESGMKSGKGFYEWPGDTGKQMHRRQNLDLIRLMKRDIEEGEI